MKELQIELLTTDAFDEAIHIYIKGLTDKLRDDCNFYLGNEVVDTLINYVINNKLSITRGSCGPWVEAFIYSFSNKDELLKHMKNIRKLIL